MHEHKPTALERSSRSSLMLLTAQDVARERHVDRPWLGWGSRFQAASQLAKLNRLAMEKLSTNKSSRIAWGMPIDAADWYLNADKLARIEACVFTSHFDRLLWLPLSPTEAVASAYQNLLSITSEAPRLSFEHAFELAARSRGGWVYACSSLQMCTCPQCDFHYIISLRGRKSACPVCAHCFSH